MNDFLKSLRSNSKDKRFDRNSRRPYNSQYNGNPQYNGHPQYKSDEEVNGNLKRGHSPGQNNDKLTKLIEGIMPDIKTLMESISENQKLRAAAEERKVELLEDIAKSFKALLKLDFSLPLDQIIENQPSENEKLSPEPENSSNIESNEEIVSTPDRETVLNIIFSMRENGSTFGEIASHLDSENIPTFSKKGTWHAQTIHRMCKKVNK